MKTYPTKMTTPPVLPSRKGGFVYKQPETGVPFEFNTWHEIVLNVMKHRQAMHLDLSDGWLQRMEHDFCEQNPHLQCVDDQVPPTFDTPLAVAGRALWQELHSYTEAYPDSPSEEDISKARYWMSNWRERIPNFGGCNCRQDWGRLVANFPPDYSSREAFVRWSVVSHDAINRKIGHPIFNLAWWEEAVKSGFNVFP